MAYLLLFFCNTLLWASFYPVTKGMVERVDPTAFACLDAALLFPIAIAMLWWHRQYVSVALLLHALPAALFLGAALLSTTIALKYTTATTSGFLVALDGVFATLIAFFILKQPIKRTTWFACAVSAGGALILMYGSLDTGGSLFGDGLSLIGGLCYLGFLFSVEAAAKYRQPGSIWASTAIQLLMTAAIVTAYAFWQADWQENDWHLPEDIGILLYVSIMTTFLPTVIAICFIDRVSTVTVGFIYILEPVWVAILAYIWLGEVLTPQAYIGGAMIVCAAMTSALASYFCARQLKDA